MEFNINKKINSKEDAISRAIEYQFWFSVNNVSYGEIAVYQAYFRKLAKRYGLIREFKENGIL